MDNNNFSQFHKNYSKAIEAVNIVANFVKGTEGILISKRLNYDNDMKVQFFQVEDMIIGRLLTDYISKKFVNPDQSDNTLNVKKIKIGITDDGCLFEIGTTDTGFYVSIHQRMLDDGRVRTAWYGHIWKPDPPVFPSR